MARSAIRVEQIPLSASTQPSVWEFLPESQSRDETWVQPVSRSLPLTSLSGRIVATTVCLANGERIPALLANIDVRNPQSTMHFLGLSVEKEQRRFRLARYHDVDYERSGPEALAIFLGLPLVDIFPIAYDISDIAEGVSDALRGQIPAEPQVRLGEADLINLALG
jgi:hypothetical protein